MTTEPKMPEALTPVQMNHIIGITRQQCGDDVADKLQRLHERVAELEQNAARYEWLRNKTSAHQHGVWFTFGFPTALGLPPIDNPMKGSVARHLDKAIDAARSKEQGK